MIAWLPIFRSAEPRWLPSVTWLQAELHTVVRQRERVHGGLGQAGTWGLPCLLSGAVLSSLIRGSVSLLPEAQHFTVLKMTTQPWVRSFPRTDDVCFQRDLCVLWKLANLSLPTHPCSGGAAASWVTVSARGGGDVLGPGEKAASLNSMGDTEG